MTVFFNTFSRKDIFLNLTSLFVALTILSMTLTTPFEIRSIFFGLSLVSLLMLKGSLNLLKQISTKYLSYLIFISICFLSFLIFNDASFSQKNYPQIENLVIFFIFFILLNQIQHHYWLISKYCIYTLVLFLSFSIPLHFFFLESSMLSATAFISNFEDESYSNKNILGLYLALLFPILIFQLSKKINFINLYSLFIFATGIFYTFSRSALIIAFVSLFLCLLSFERKLVVTALIISSTIAFTLWIFEITPQKYNEMKIKTNIEYFNSESFDEKNSYKSFSPEGARFGYLRRSYEGFLQKPIFGNGFASFRRNNPIYDDKGTYIRSPVTHNDFAQIIYELGLIGLISFCFMIFFNFKSLMSTIRKSESKVKFIQLVILILAINSINLIDHIIFWFIIALTLNNFSKSKLSESDNVYGKNNSIY